MKKCVFPLIIGLLGLQVAFAQEAPSLLTKRGGHETKLTKKLRREDPLAVPPDDTFTLVQYPTKIGNMAAYLSAPKDPKKKQPAIIWITGGFPLRRMDCQTDTLTF